MINDEPKTKQIIELCKKTIDTNNKIDYLYEAFKLLGTLISNNYRDIEINKDTIKINYYENDNGIDDLIEEWRNLMSVDCFSVIMFANINKYLGRCQYKNGWQDLLKAKEYLKLWIMYLNEES